MKAISVVFLIFLMCIQCQRPNEIAFQAAKDTLKFDPSIFSVKSNEKFQKARGQILYLPLYSNIPYAENKEAYNLSGFLTIHNTDFAHDLIVIHIFYFHNDGHLIKDFLLNDTLKLKPLQSQSFFIPEKDKGGTGANFLVEWKTPDLLNIPLIETVMLSLKSGQGVSFLSTGKVIEQMD